MDNQKLMNMWYKRIGFVGRENFNTGKEVQDTDIDTIYDIISAEYPELFSGIEPPKEAKVEQLVDSYEQIDKSIYRTKAPGIINKNKVVLEYSVPEDIKMIDDMFDSLLNARNVGYIKNILSGDTWFKSLKYDQFSLAYYMEKSNFEKCQTLLGIHYLMFKDKYFINKYSQKQVQYQEPQKQIQYQEPQKQIQYQEPQIVEEPERQKLIILEIPDYIIINEIKQMFNWIIAAEDIQTIKTILDLPYKKQKNPISARKICMWLFNLSLNDRTLKDHILNQDISKIHQMIKICLLDL